MNITKGEWRVFSDDFIAAYTNGGAESIVCQFFNLEEKDFPDKQDNAELIAEAGTIANQTGLSPKQLLEQRDMLVAALREKLIQSAVVWAVDRETGEEYADNWFKSKGINL